MKANSAKRAGPECLGFAARLLSRMISGIYDDALAESGLKVSQFSLLTAIANGDDPRPAELAKSLAMDESTMSRNVARMCARGWLRLAPGDDDRRSHQAQREIARRLGAEGVKSLRLVMNKLRSSA